MTTTAAVFPSIADDLYNAFGFLAGATLGLGLLALVVFSALVH
jgi:hypothetical protein